MVFTGTMVGMERQNFNGIILVEKTCGKIFGVGRGVNRLFISGNSFGATCKNTNSPHNAQSKSDHVDVLGDEGQERRGAQQAVANDDADGASVEGDPRRYPLVQ